MVGRLQTGRLLAGKSQVRGELDMRNRFRKKRKMAESVIGGADGPTSVFAAGRRTGISSIADATRSLRHRYRIARARKKITPGAHTLDEVEVFLFKHYDVMEAGELSRRYKEEKKNCKTMLVQREHPEWMEELRQFLPSEPEDEKMIQEFLRKSEELEERAASVPEEAFPMDFHYYRIRVKGYGVIDLVMEKNREFLSYSASYGKTYGGKRVNRIVKEIFQYYGVTEEDIREETERYHFLAAILALDT